MYVCQVHVDPAVLVIWKAGWLDSRASNHPDSAIRKLEEKKVAAACFQGVKFKVLVLFMGYEAYIICYSFFLVV